MQHTTNYFFMTILLLGSGGREHALAWKMLQSPLCTQLLVAPGNAGTAQVATNLMLYPTDFESVKKAVLAHQVQMVVVGPEDPLVAGIVDFFENDAQLNHIPVIGPSALGAQLEGSKEFAKEFMVRHGIPTAAYESFTAETVEKGCRFLESLTPPYVLKADGLAAGKGVLIIADLAQAQDELRQMLVHSKFGKASAKVVIEEFLDGIELSCFVLTDGKNYQLLPTAKDYKRIGEADTGLNTGGMGAVSPVPFADATFMQKVEQQIVVPTVQGLFAEKINYKGFIFIGLINVGGNPKVIEYNVRMGDPETEVVIPRLENDLIELFKATAEQKLNEVQIKIHPQTAATVVVVSGGYPEDYQKGKEITGFEKVEGSLVFHAGTQEVDGQILSNGGRVLAVTSLGDSIQEATKKSYQNIVKLHFDTMYFRKDIGRDLLL